MRVKARAAYKFLKSSPKSSYKDFLQQRNEFIARTPDADERQRRRPAFYLETVGLECAVWPTLYWRTD
eukprot:10685557-Karenia_brevis.AAC.1